jgi:hypothetical protein
VDVESVANVPEVHATSIFMTDTHFNTEVGGSVNLWNIGNTAHIHMVHTPNNRINKHIEKENVNLSPSLTDEATMP